MSDSPPHHVPLTVLPNSGKVDQLRKDFVAAPPNGNLADRTVIDRAIDQSKSAAQKAVEEKVIDALRTVYDPEIPVSIYDLGLIYSIDIAPDNAVKIKMTLTAPGCPVAGTLPAEVARKIELIDEVPSASVELVWEPQWTKERMSEAALLELGLL